MPSRPDVSILIPVHNGVEFTEACLRSIYPTVSLESQQVEGAPTAEILIYDDRSTDGTADLLERERDRVRTIRGNDRGSFAINTNRLAAEARGEYLVMLNNDTLVRPGWLGGMLTVARAHPDAGIVGNLHVFPERHESISPGECRINHAGVIFDEEKHARHLYEGLPEGLAAAAQTRRMRAVSAACWLAPADFWAELGGFDEAYVNGHEDIDVCLRAQEMGRTIWYAGESVIEHHGSSTPGRFDDEDANYTRFCARWNDSIEPDLEETVVADGVAWPRRSAAYRLARSVWRWPPTRAVLRRVLSSRLGTRVRSAVHRRLVSSR